MARISKLKRYNPATASGVFVLRDTPKRFPLFFAAVMHIKFAMNEGCEKIRVERIDSPEYMEWNVVYVYQEAIKRGLMRSSMGVAFPDEVQKRIPYWQGAAFS